MASSGIRSTKATGAGKKRCGPMKPEKEARLLHTGSVNKRNPSTSISKLECPTQVIRNPDAGACLYIDVSVVNGPNFRLGVVSALLVIYRHNTPHNDPVLTLVGIGFKYFLPSFTAGCKNSM